MKARTWGLFSFGLLLGATACSSKDGDTGDGDGDGATTGDGDAASGGSLGDGDTASGGGFGDGDLGTGGGLGDGDGDAVCTLDQCGVACVDTQTDNANCGACGTSCTQYQTCMAGDCVQTSCPDALELCSGDCADTTNDAQHCGSCGLSCDPSYVCAGSSCGCEAGQQDCGVYCSYADYDRQNCGGCSDSGGSVCGDDEACVDGGCTTIGVPGETYCDVTQGWDAAWTAWEFEILDIVNQRRAEGADCGSEGYFAPTGPLQMEESLRCAARVHSKDMADNDYFSHDTQGGGGPGSRLNAAGYSGNGWGENIARGYSSPESAMAGWMSSDGHCSNLMNPNFSLIGVGYAKGPGNNDNLWTQTFGN